MALTTPVTQSMSANSLRPPSYVYRKRTVNWLGVGLVVALLVWSYGGTDISPGALVSGLGEAWQYVFGNPERPNSGYFPPNFERFDTYFASMIETIQMAIWGTFLCVPLAVVLGFLGVQNVQSNAVVYQAARRLMDFLRSLNDLIIALVFVAAVGLGPFTGVLALAIGGIGSLGKLISEAVEAVNMDQVEAVRATGAHPLQVMSHGFWPQALPLFISYTLFRFEINVRAATILGIVGAGGIGFYLTQTMRTFANRDTCAILIIIIVSVFLIDWTSSQIRKRII